MLRAKSITLYDSVNLLTKQMNGCTDHTYAYLLLIAVYLKEEMNDWLHLEINI